MTPLLFVIGFLVAFLQALVVLILMILVNRISELEVALRGHINDHATHKFDSRPQSGSFRPAIN